MAEFFDKVTLSLPPSAHMLSLGCGFGRYGLMAEFASTSPRVASFAARNIQTQAGEYGKRGSSTISASTIIGRKMTFSEPCHKLKRAEVEKLRAYVFLNPTAGCSQRALSSIYKYVDGDPNLTLFWNSSAFSSLLVIDGDCFLDIFGKLVGLKQVLKGEIASTSTFFVLKWDQEKRDFCVDSPKFRDGHAVRIPAIVYAKLKASAGRIPAPSFKIKSPLWRKMFSHDTYQFRRPGWLDECIGIEGETLYEIMNAVCGLIDDNSSFIAHTSTILLCPSGGME